VSFIATDTKGKVRPGKRYDTTMTLKKEAAETAFRTGVRVLSQIELPKGNTSCASRREDTPAPAVSSMTSTCRISARGCR
jgi:hypothetical protein